MQGADLGMVFIDSRILIFSFLLLCVLAVPCPAKYGGEGTAEEPYLICTAAEMNEIGLYPDDWNKHFALMADINLSEYSGKVFNMIGDHGAYEPFTGVFDGRGHVISNFSCSFTSQGIGIFSYVGGQSAQVKNVGLINPFVGLPGIGISEAPLVGVLEDGTVSNCWVSDGYVFGRNVVGGVVGDNIGGTISNCYSDVVVTASDSDAGGIAAVNSGAVENCYFTGQVQAEYNSAGAIVGVDVGGTYAGCFWDKSIVVDVNGIGNLEPDPCGVIGETTANMQTAATFINAGWDIVSPTNTPLMNIWRMCEDGLDYPHLAVEYNRCDFACPDGVGISDLAVFAEYWLLIRFDVDVDFKPDNLVNMKDWAVFAAAWRTKTGDENYDADVDIVPNGVIDKDDMELFIDYWLMRGGYYLKADIESYEGDGIVNGRDYAVFANEWLGGD
jgi:hypothetical protein